MTQEIQLIVDKHKIWLDTDGEQGEQADFSNMDLQELEFKDLDLSNSIFRNCSLIRTNIVNCKFDGSDFTNTAFNYSVSINNSFKHCNMINTDFDGAIIEYSNFSLSNLKKTNFYNTRTRYLNFANSIIDNCNFVNAVLLGADLKKTIIINTNFDGANISKSLFRKTELHNCNLDSSIGVPSKNTSIEVEDLEEEYISRNSQIKLLKKLSKIFYVFGILLTIIISSIGIFELYNMLFRKLEYSNLNFNYISWIVLDIFIILLATFLNLFTKWIIRDDKIHKKELNNG